MAKGHDKPVGKAGPTIEGRRPYGWYVTNFGSWFEIDGGGYRRKGGLEFVRLFVSAGGVKSTESSQFLQLMAVLRTISPERYHHNRGVYFDLVGLTATLQRCYRGRLLDESLKPLTDKGMAGRLFMAPEVMRQAIKDLQESGLIQRSRLPEFDPSADKEREDERTEGQDRKSRQREKVEKPRTRARAKASREDLQTFADSSEALNELTNDQSQRENLNGQVAKGEREQDAPTAPAAAPPEEPGARAMKPQGVSDEGPRHHQPSAGGKPAYAPPAVSTGPRIVPLHHDGGASPIQHLLPRALDGLAHGYAVRADDFAREIFGRLRAPFDANSRDGVRELGNYRAALLDAVDAGLSPAAMEELMAKARRDAAMIASHRKRYYRNDGSPERYWRFLFNKHLAARRRGKPESRAGPASAAG